jgi:hypothetical protein
LFNEPANYARLLAPIPDGVVFSSRASATTDLAHIFATRRVDLAKRLPALRKKLRPDAALWVSWPKRGAGVETDISEDVVRAAALPLGFVDVKVCAVDAIWSGLKLVVRKQLR